MNRLARSLVLIPLFAGCVRTVGDGPPLGACAEPPEEGAYTFGNAGIGTCLAGPLDVQFRVVGGEPVLAVVNGDPFRSFSSGSLLILDAEQLPAQAGTVTIDTLQAAAMPIDRFGGRLAFDGFNNVALVPTRLSEGTYVRRTPDKVWLVDLTEPFAPRLASRPFVGVGADPYATAVLDRRAYVANGIQPSLSVIDLATSPPSTVPVSPTSVITRPVLTRVGNSLGHAELSAQVAEDLQITRTDAFSATWLDGVWRLWIPEEEGLSQVVGLGTGEYRPSARRREIDASSTELIGEINDPWLTSDGTRLVMWFVDDGALRVAFTDGSFGAWAFDVGEAFPTGNDWWARIGGPSFTGYGGTTLVYFDGRPSADAPASIGVASTTDTVNYTVRPDPVLVAPAGWESIEQPSALLDPHTGAVRVWASVRQGSSWAIAHAASTDVGNTFGEAEVVLSLPGESAAAPVVTWTGGRYLMWLSVHDGLTWSHATAWSWDGWTWSDPQIVASSDRTDVLAPPRAAVQPVPTEAWQLEGVESTVLTPPLISGTPWSSSSRGFTLDVASGFDTGTEAGFDLPGGLRPRSLAVVNGLPTLYATGIDETDRSRLVALRRLGDVWVATVSDLIPAGAGGNIEGVRDPVVFQRGSGWLMLYAAADGGLWRIRRASSSDGLFWNPIAGDALPDAAGFESVEQVPGSVVEAPDGWHLFYVGTDGGRWRVGEAVSTDGIRWTRVPGVDGQPTLGTGEPGAFDDSGVRAPSVSLNGTSWSMWYEGWDGAQTTIGRASREGSGAWERRLAPVSGQPDAILRAVASTFAAGGVGSPVVTPSGGLWYAGWDGKAWRIGEAIASQGELYPAHRFPSGGDAFRFDTTRGVPGRSTIPLARVIDGLVLPGTPGTAPLEGFTSIAADPARGFLYLGSKDFAGIVVVDVRDDSTASWVDRNAWQIETVLRFETTTGGLGVHDVLLASDGLLYAGAREPDALLVIDVSNIVDDADDELMDRAVLGSIPMRDLTDDEGNETFAAVGASSIAEVPGTSLLLVAQMRDNSVSVIDRSLGTWGEEVARIPNVVEAPVVVRVSPDATYAVVAGYLGGAGGDAEGSGLAIIPLVPAASDYLQVRSRIVNR